MEFVLKGKKLENIFYRSANVIFQEVQVGKKWQKCYIVGNGHSVSVDKNCIVTKHDPAMENFKCKLDEDSEVYAFYFTFECSGLEEASKEIANFIDVFLELYEEVILIGHSKCGICLYKTTYYCKRRVKLVTISAPFKGTVIADKEEVNRRIKSRFLKKLYNLIFSDHNVDRDIIPDSKFIKGLEGCPLEHINITSSLKDVHDCRGPVDVFLLLLDRILGIYGDGIVPLDSQKKEGAKEYDLHCSHANSLKHGIKQVN